MTARTNLDLILARLRDIHAPEPRVVSCYVRLDQPARNGGRYLLEIKARVQELIEWLDATGLPRDVRADVEADLRELTAWLEHPARLPHAPGAALFACRSLGVFDVVPLGRVHRTRVDVDRMPLLQELVGAREALGSYLAALFDRSHARFFDVGALDTIELAGLPALARRGGKYEGDRGDAPGWGERRYHQRLAEEKHRHYARIAAELVRLATGSPYQGVVLLGPSEHTHALKRFLPRRLASLVMGERPLNPTATSPDQVHQAVWSLEAEFERTQELAVVTAMEEGVATGWGVNGPRETLRALSRGQLGTLLLPNHQRGAGFRCGASGRLVLAKADCRGEGEPEPVFNLVDQTIEVALDQGVDVVVIDDPDVGRRIDGMAGTLRFALGKAVSTPRGRRSVIAGRRAHRPARR